MGPRLRQPPDTGNATRRRNIGCGLLALLLNGALVYLLASLGTSRSPEAPVGEPIVAHLILEPLRLHLDSRLPALTPRLKPILRPADRPPDFPIETPVETPAPRVPSDPQMADGSPTAPRVTDEAGEGAGIKILHYVPGVYSVESAKSHEHGIVTLRVLVDEQGKPSQVQVLDSSGFARLDEAATAAVWQYRFSRTMKGSRALQVWTTVKQEFEPIPMPVPTTVVSMDTVVAMQIDSAIRADAHTHPVFHAPEAVIKRIASRAVRVLSNDRGRAEDLQRAGLSSTPGERFVAQGEVKSIQFIGFASLEFGQDIPLSAVAPEPATLICEIFELRQARGTSYLLAMFDRGGLRLRGVQISIPTEPLRAAAARPSLK